MQRQIDEEAVKLSLTSTSAATSSFKPLFEDMSATSDDVNRVLIATADETNIPAPRPQTVFEALQMLTRPSDESGPPRKRAKPPLNLDHTAVLENNEPETPSQNKSKWSPSIGLSEKESCQRPLTFPVLPMSDEELVRMKGPSRLIGFLIDIAMNERARRALRWTGTGLEFILVDKELVAKMWGNRKHNTKEMNYLKLARAIREKYGKDDKNSVTKTGKLKKGSRTYSYVFTENAYPELTRETTKTIEKIKDFALQIGNKYRDSLDIHSCSPQAHSPYNSDE